MTEEELEALFETGLTDTAAGDIVPLPSMPLLAPPPGPDDPSVAQAVEQGRLDQEATGERSSTDRVVEDIAIGDEIVLSDGSRAKVTWLHRAKGRIAIGKGRNKTFVSLRQIEVENGDYVARELTKKKRKRKQEGGDPRPEPDVKLPPTVPKGLFPYQLENVAFIMREGPPHGGLIADEMGLGKAQPLDARVLTPSGWTRMGNLKVGDAVVDPDTGGAATVTAVHERGELDCYRVTTSDGCSTECCNEHLWCVQTPHDKLSDKWRVLRLSELGRLHQETSRGDRRRRWFLPLTRPVAGQHHNLDLPLHPYLLGLLLGDGTMPHCQRRGTGSLSCPSFSTADDELRDAVAQRLPWGVSLKQSSSYDYRISRDYDTPHDQRLLRNPLAVALEGLGLCGCGSAEKFVPEPYLRTTATFRLALLRGLMDTDGGVTGSAAEYSTTSPHLRDAVVELVYSLGGFCTVYEKTAPAYTYKGEKRVGRPAWRVYMRMPTNPFQLKRKAEAWKPGNMTRGIESVERVGRKRMRCIAVNSKRNLYITDGYIVTHNTISAIACIQPPAVVVCPALLKVNWVREINRWMPDLSVALVSGTKQRGRQPRWREEEIRIQGAEAGDLHQQAADVVVINYEIVGPHLPWLTARGNKTIIFDEAHYLKELRTGWDPDLRQWVADPKPARAAAAYALRAEVVEGGRLIELTGTPILNRAIELWPLLHLLDRRKTGDDGSRGGFSSRTKFCMRYCAGVYEEIRVRGAGKRKRLNCDGLSNAAELHTRISGVYMMRHTKEAELKDLPAKKRDSIDVSLSPKYAKMYRRARTSFYDWIAENGGPEAVMAAQRAEALVQLTKLRAISAQGKAIAAIQYIANFFESTGRPLVVMGEHRSAFALIEAGIEEVNAQYEKAVKSGKQPLISRPIRMGTVVGGQGARQRQKTIDAFQKHGTIDVLLYSIRIATGVTLTRSSDMLFIERLWRPADQVQAEDRVHRIGQTQKVQIVYMDAAGTVDMKLGLLLADKVRAAAAIIDGEDLGADEALIRVFGESWGRLLTGKDDGTIQITDDMLDDLVREGNAQADAMAREELKNNPRTERLFTEDGEWFDGFEYDDEELEPNPRYDFAWDADSWGDPL